MEGNLQGRDLEGFITPTVNPNCSRKRLSLSALLEANGWLFNGSHKVTFTSSGGIQRRLPARLILCGSR